MFVPNKFGGVGKKKCERDIEIFEPFSYYRFPELVRIGDDTSWERIDHPKIYSVFETPTYAFRHPVVRSVSEYARTIPDRVLPASINQIHHGYSTCKHAQFDMTVYMTASAIRTALSAAPRSSWSPTTNMSRPYSPKTSLARSRPTSTSNFVEAVIGIG